MKDRFKRIYIEITNKCNLQCKFCPKTKRKLEEMPSASFEKILQKIQGYSKYIYLHVKGEPLLHKEFEKIMQLVEQYGFYVIITTNGTFLNEQKDILKKCKNLRQINVSVHSFLQNENNSQKMYSYIENVIDVIDEITLNNPIYISYRLWNMSNINNVNEIEKELAIIANKYNKQDLLTIAKKQSFIELGDNKYINLDVQYEWPSLEKDIISMNGKCYGLIDQIAILVNGTVVPCCLDQEGDIDLGNIYIESLEEILEKQLSKDIMKGFRENKLVNPLCQKCGFREIKRQ